MLLGVSTIARQRLNRKAAAEPGWDPTVIGGVRAAFYGNQYASMAPLPGHCGAGGGQVEAHGIVLVRPGAHLLASGVSSAADAVA
jgi:hypothetical protein